MKVHHCKFPEATREDWKAEVVWECHYCKRRYVVTLGSEWYGFMSTRIRDKYEWTPYTGPVED